MFRKSIVSAALLVLLVAHPATAQQYPLEEEPQPTETTMVSPPDDVDENTDKGDERTPEKFKAAGNGEKLPDTGADNIDQLIRVAAILMVAGFTLHQSGRYRGAGAAGNDPEHGAIKAT